MPHETSCKPFSRRTAAIATPLSSRGDLRVIRIAGGVLPGHVCPQHLDKGLVGPRLLTHGRHDHHGHLQDPQAAVGPPHLDPHPLHASVVVRVRVLLLLRLAVLLCVAVHRMGRRRVSQAEEVQAHKHPWTEPGLVDAAHHDAGLGRAGLEGHDRQARGAVRKVHASPAERREVEPRHVRAVTVVPPKLVPTVNNQVPTPARHSEPQPRRGHEAIRGALAPHEALEVQLVPGHDGRVCARQGLAMVCGPSEGDEVLAPVQKGGVGDCGVQGPPAGCAPARVDDLPQLGGHVQHVHEGTSCPVLYPRKLGIL
mmetsp:Transcript_87923/g.262198  ORF Transcript_87923/g.262198 Transcript_87923/m.262198 type:complete len:311 (-) Transcript_87923:936-1868(-)